jgi:hypothetical protein
VYQSIFSASIHPKRTTLFPAAHSFLHSTASLPPLLSYTVLLSHGLLSSTIFCTTGLDAPSNAPRAFIMSVVASRPDSATVPYSPITQSHGYKEPITVTVQPVSSRTSSISSFKSNYSVSTAPTVYSPISPNPSYHLCDSAASLDKILESKLKRLPLEVLDNILTQLECLHTGSNQQGCLTCYQRDLHALSLTCRLWERAVRPKL